MDAGEVSLRPSRTEWGYVADQLSGEIRWNIFAELRGSGEVIFFKQAVGSEDEAEMVGDAAVFVSWLKELGHCVHRDREKEG